MGPLVPDIISSSLNLIIALIIGMMFGAILEQAGFSTSRKLVGLFYGYDFTVLRVFFTAGIVAMIGVMLFQYLGLIDINLIYINPTYFWSAIVGGLIMGLGFILGGFCPGTSVCALAIGKLDALVFIAGIFVGVIIFAEGYPLFEGLYKAAYWGIPRFYETLGISQNLFAFLMIIMALAAFLLGEVVERKVNHREKLTFQFNRFSTIFALCSLLLIILSLTLKDRKEILIQKVSDSSYVQSYPLEEVQQDQFALCILKSPECDQLQIFDFRPEDDYKKMTLPRSIPLTMEDLFGKEARKYLNLRHKINIFIAGDELTERKMAIIARELGYRDVKILKGGLTAFMNQLQNFKPIENPRTIIEKSYNRFWSRAIKAIPRIIAENKPRKVEKKKPKRVIGGC